MKKRASSKSEINLNKKLRSPRNFRSITESVFSFVREEKYTLIASVLGIFFFCWMLLAVVQLSGALRMREQVAMERAKVMHDLSFWQGVVQGKPDYRDGYFMLAVVQYRIGNKKDALENVAKALKIDPNFKEGREFEQMLK